MVALSDTEGCFLLPAQLPTPSPIPVAAFSIFTELPDTKWNLNLHFPDAG